VVVALEDLLNGLLAVAVDVLEELVLDLQSLVAELLLHLASHYAEERVVNYIVGEVEDLVVGGLIVKDLLLELLQGCFLVPEEVLDQLLSVHVKDVFVLLVAL
jgi:hypothetical protein